MPTFSVFIGNFSQHADFVGISGGTKNQGKLRTAIKFDENAVPIKHRFRRHIPRQHAFLNPFGVACGY